MSAFLSTSTSILLLELSVLVAILLYISISSFKPSKSIKMKLSTIHFVALAYSACCAASEDTTTRSNTGTCSLGIARIFGSISWDITIYNVPQAIRQDANIIAKSKQQSMDKGQSITIQSPASAVTITNLDNAPAFDYDSQVINATITDPSNGQTKVKLDFELASGNTTWSTDDCESISVIFTGGREGWTCDFPCSVESATKREEL